jgi:hypothetical protein
MAFIAAGGVIQEPDKKKFLETAYVEAGGKIAQAENNTLKASPPIATSGEIKESDNGGVSNGQRKLVTDAVKDYLADCKDRQGKSGCGCSDTQDLWRPPLLPDRVQAKGLYGRGHPGVIKSFRRFLRKHDNELADRTSYNIMQAVSTFLHKNGSGVAKPFLKEMSYPPTEVSPLLQRRDAEVLCHLQ